MLADRADDRGAKGNPVFGVSHDAGLGRGLAQEFTAQGNASADRNRPPFLVDDDGRFDAGFLYRGLRQYVQALDLS